MPYYTIYNSKTKKEETVSMKMSELETLLNENKHLTQVFTPPNLVMGASVMGAKGSKPDSGFRDLLKQVKKSNRGAKINTF